jgi:hypothetical protein
MRNAGLDDYTTCKISDRHREHSEPPRTRGQSLCRAPWIASSALPPRNDESMILQDGITGVHAAVPIFVNPSVLTILSAIEARDSHRQSLA